MEDLQYPSAISTTPDRGSKAITRGFLDEYERITPLVRALFENAISIVFDDVSRSSTDLILKHNLGAIPSDFLVGARNKNGAIWRGETPWTSQELSVRSNTLNLRVTIYLVT